MRIYFSPATCSVLLLLLLTACSTRSEPAPVESVYQGRSVYDYTQGSLSSASYQVQQGETLYSIAFRANMDMRDIARLNNLSEPYTIFPGQVLRIRKESVKTPVTPPKSGLNGVESRQVSNIEHKNSKKTDLKDPIDSKTNGEYVETESVNQESEKQRTNSNGKIEWFWPSQGRIVQRFSDSEPGRKGLVFAGQKGDPVTAAAAGKVVYVGSALRGFGRLIILKHSDDYITAYAHNDELLVREQQSVEAGQKIATMGDSEADNVRLRFELRYQGSSVNPERYLPRSR
ncbi:peptidase M23 [Aliidiomarina minuta]|uniref:Peptidase M23 n=1 Tax=Aliidiomarina minuta TaxID=880057 RepID=A0A432W6W2_9GAMM|nr:peptidoglycan DD-metalloendopeptidase family protein [Aliidiomarina minuta]RUO25807.1 peptidase M23 [Aliidiomarina minuta]